MSANLSRGILHQRCYNLFMYKKYQIVLAVAAFIINKDNQLLIVKKSPYERIDPELWVVPGGKIKPKEKLINGLKREIKEEVNLDIVSYKWINENVFENHGFYFHAQHFLCKVKNIKEIKLEKSLTDYLFISKKDIKKYQIPQGLLETMKMIL